MSSKKANLIRSVFMIVDFLLAGCTPAGIYNCQQFAIFYQIKGIIRQVFF